MSIGAPLRTIDAIAACTLAVALALLGAAPAPSAAAVVTFGSNLPDPTPGYYDSCSEACTTAQVALEGAQTTSPVDGTVVRFRLRTGAGSDPQSLRFRVLRSTDGGNTFTGAGTSEPFPIPTTAGITEFPVDMPIRAGDYIGIDEPGGVKKAYVIATNNAAFQAGWFPALADGGTPRPSGNAQGSPPTVFDLLLQADVEPTPEPTPTATPTSTPAPTPPPAPTPLNCTNAMQVATCADPNGMPSMCGATTAGFPQCSMPFDLPATCSSKPAAAPVCGLPGNYIVACGGFGLGLAVCNLPPLSVPQVCGPTTAGLPACAPANTQVLACGPTSLGLPACNFKTLIKAPKPIDISSGALDLVVSCPDAAAGSAAGAGAAGATTAQATSCEGNIDIESLAGAKTDALLAAVVPLAAVYLNPKTVGGSLNPNAASFALRARQLIYDELHSDPARLDSSQYYPPYARLSASEHAAIVAVLYSQYPRYHGFSIPPYQGPTETWQNADTLLSARTMASKIAAAVDELYQLQEKLAKAKPKASAAVAARPSAKKAKPLVHKRFKARRGKRGTRIHLRLSRKVVRELRKRASRKSHAVAVRMVVSFKAKPRPIVRFVDFRLPVTRKATTRKRAK